MLPQFHLGSFSVPPRDPGRNRGEIGKDVSIITGNASTRHRFFLRQSQLPGTIREETSKHHRFRRKPWQVLEKAVTFLNRQQVSDPTFALAFVPIQTPNVSESNGHGYFTIS